MFKVQKKDGTTEDFDREKIISGALKAGATAEEAEKIATEIEAWMPGVAVENVIASSEIRTKGLEVLKEVNPDIATKFESFQKPTQG
jgi:transcriptional regulator NrdR family protein